MKTWQRWAIVIGYFAVAFAGAALVDWLHR
jgi:hypothetical protein